MVASKSWIKYTDWLKHLTLFNHLNVVILQLLQYCVTVQCRQSKSRWQLQDNKTQGKEGLQQHLSLRQKQSQLYSACERGGGAEKWEDCIMTTGRRRNSRRIAADRCGRRAEGERRPTSSSRMISPAGPDAPSSSWGDTEWTWVQTKETNRKAERQQQQNGQEFPFGLWRKTLPLL